MNESPAPDVIVDSDSVLRYSYATQPASSKYDYIKVRVHTSLQLQQQQLAISIPGRNPNPNEDAASAVSSPSTTSTSSQSQSQSQSTSSYSSAAAASSNYYVFSRYILARRLSFTLLPSFYCILIALTIKKDLVDHNQFDVTRSYVDECIEREIRNVASSNALLEHSTVYIQRYRTLQQFFAQSIPLIILLQGPPLSGKSNLARKLANRLSVTTVIQTNLIYSLLARSQIKQGENGSAADPNFSDPESITNSLPSPRVVPMIGQRGDELMQLLKTEFKSFEEFDRHMKKCCTEVFEALREEVKKCLDNGRTMIVEGCFIDVMEWLSLANPISTLTRSANKPVILLPFVLSLPWSDHQLIAHNALHRYADVSSTMRRNLLWMKDWGKKQYESQRNRWKSMKAEVEAQNLLTSPNGDSNYISTNPEDCAAPESERVINKSAPLLPLVPVEIDVSLASLSDAVDVMHRHALKALVGHCSP